jgi:hypothetical protein
MHHGYAKSMFRRHTEAFGSTTRCSSKHLPTLPVELRRIVFQADALSEDSTSI